MFVDGYILDIILDIILVMLPIFQILESCFGFLNNTGQKLISLKNVTESASVSSNIVFKSTYIYWQCIYRYFNFLEWNYAMISMQYVCNIRLLQFNIVSYTSNFSFRLLHSMIILGKLQYQILDDYHDIQISSDTDTDLCCSRWMMTSSSHALRTSSGSDTLSWTNQESVLSAVDQ